MSLFPKKSGVSLKSVYPLRVGCMEGFIVPSWHLFNNLNKYNNLYSVVIAYCLMCNTEVQIVFATIYKYKGHPTTTLAKKILLFLQS